MRNILIFIILATSLSCVKKKELRSVENYQDLKIKETKQYLQIRAIDIDTVLVKNQESISGDGFWKVRDDTFYYFDRALSVVDKYNADGEFQDRALGVGRGPGEIEEEIGTVCRFGQEWLLVDIYNVFQFTREFKNKKRKYLFHWDENFAKKKQALMKNPHPETDAELYVPAYDYPQMSYLKDEKVLMKMSCEYPDCCDGRYYKESATMAIYDFEQGTITRLMGAYPPCYQGESFAASFAIHYYTPYKRKNFLQSFGLDSLMYVCDDDFVPQKAFGCAARFENESYDLTNSHKNKTERYDYEKELKTKGYYTSVYYYAEEEITFRVYKAGVKNVDKSEDLYYLENPSRMQIYKGYDLIGDVEVPTDFEIIGYQAPYFYADGYTELGEDGDSIGYYKFKIKL